MNKLLITFSLLLCSYICNGSYLNWKLSDDYIKNEYIQLSDNSQIQRYIISIYEWYNINDKNSIGTVYLYNNNNNIKRLSIGKNHSLEFRIYDIISYNYNVDKPFYNNIEEYYIGSTYVDTNWLIDNNYTREIYNYYDYGQTDPNTYIVTMPIPEPNSFILLFFGIAIIALKRQTFSC